MSERDTHLERLREIKMLIPLADRYDQHHLALTYIIAHVESEPARVAKAVEAEREACASRLQTESQRFWGVKQKTLEEAAAILRSESRCPCCGQIYGCYCHEHPHEDNPACPGRALPVEPSGETPATDTRTQAERDAQAAKNAIGGDDNPNRWGYAPDERW